MVDTERGARAHQRIGERIEPAKYCVDVDLSPECYRHTQMFYQKSGALNIGSSQCVLHRFSDQSMQLIPRAGSTVELSHDRRLCPLQAVAQHFSKQVMIAIPLAFVVERDHKQVCSVEGFQCGLALLLTCHSITERAAKALQDAGVEQERLHRRGLLREHFLGEVVQDEAMTAGEGVQKGRDIGSPPQ